MDWFNNIPLSNLIHRIFYLYSNNDFIGCVNNDNSIIYSSFSSIWNDCLCISSYLNKYLQSRSVIGILGPNCSQWLISDISCMLNNFISVGLHCSWNNNKINEIIKITNMKCLIIHSSFISQLSLVIKENKSLEMIIIMDNYNNTDILSQISLPCFTWNNILSNSNIDNSLWNKDPNVFIMDNDDNDNDICTLLFTSGSTGKPKGVCITKKRWKRDLLCFPFAGCDKPLTILSYMALAHGADRLLCWQMLNAGGRIAMINAPNHNELMNAIQISKPTFFLGLSHFWSSVYNDYRQELTKQTSQQLYEYIKTNHSNILLSIHDITSCFNNSVQLLYNFSQYFEIKDELLENVRINWFGGRLFTPVTGGAHTSQLVLDWMTEVFAPKTTSGSEQGSRVQDAYGTTEFPGISVNGEINNLIQLELVDVPEMNYYTTDKPFARGEIKVRYKDPDIKVQYWNTEETQNNNEWYYTGDIGYLDTQNRDEFDIPHLHIIDRRQNLVEIYINGDSIWIGVDKLEKKIFSVCPGVQQICLLADRNSPGLIAIVVPDIKGKEYTNNDFMNIFKEYGKINNLQSYEIPLDVIIQNYSWTIENEYLTSSGKIRRGLVQKQYQNDIETIYAILENNNDIQSTNSTNNTSKYYNNIHILENLYKQLLKEQDKEYIPQDTSCSDFINFRFKLPSKEQTNKLNQYLEILSNDVKIIRKESSIWRKETKEQIDKQTEIVNNTVQEFNNKVKIETNNLIKDIEKLDNTNYKQLYELILNYIKLLSKRQCIFTKLYTNLRNIESTPHKKHKEVTERYGYNLSELMKYAEKYCVRVPYQIWASGWWKSPDSNEDPANMLTTPLGSAEVFCNISGERIEKDVSEIGRERWHCIDLSNINHSIESHQQMIDIRNIIKKIFKNKQDNIQNTLDLLIQVDPYENYVWVKETAHFWHLRTSIDEDNEINPAEFFRKACISYSNRPALGIPNPDIITNPLVPKHSSPFAEAAKIEFSKSNGYLWLSYSEIFKLSSIIAKYLLSLQDIKEGSTIGICGYNNIEWAICDFACALAGCVSIGLHTTNNDELCESVINTSNIICILCTKTRLDSTSIKKETSFSAHKVLENCPSVKYLAVLDDYLKNISNNILEKFKTVKISSLVDIISNPKHIENIKLPDTSCFDLSSLATILFTSGSSGTPKGVMVTRKSFYNDISQRVFVEPLITPSYIPLSHSSDRMKMWEFIGNGGRIGFSYYGAINWIEHEREKKNSMIELTSKQSNHVEQLFAQVSMLQPTAMSCPPRIWTGLYALYHHILLKNNHNESKTKQYIKNMFGNRISFLITGGGPTPSDIYNFFKDLFYNISFCDSYGTTESGAITSNGYPIISKGISIKLLPIKSLNVKEDDNSIGYIGEIVVSSPNISAGYFNSKEETEKCFINGWYHTGDIGKRIDYDKYKILGRVSSAISINNNIIFPGSLEILFEMCNEISQICLYYLSTKNKLIAIIVPINDNISKDNLLNIIQIFGKQINLKEYEIPSNIIINKSWTKENGLLTEQLKIARKRIIQKNIKIINNL